MIFLKTPKVKAVTIGFCLYALYCMYHQSLGVGLVAFILAYLTYKD